MKSIPILLPALLLALAACGPSESTDAPSSSSSASSPPSSASPQRVGNRPNPPGTGYAHQTNAITDPTASAVPLDGGAAYVVGVLPWQNGGTGLGSLGAIGQVLMVEDGGVLGYSTAVGPAGGIGPTGATGAASTIPGPTGPTGANGTNGTNGSNGAVGATGATGPTGANGTNGSNGATGATGPTGANGTNGSNGAIGATGPTGANGTNGSNGAVGATGATGAVGATGATGAAGATGSAGSNGAVGATGAAGSNGAVGATGPTGAQGDAGVAGTNGSNGAVGATGATGATGPAGATGAASTVAGPTGATGAAGATGATGASGTSTLAGDVGGTASASVVNAVSGGVSGVVTVTNPIALGTGTVATAGSLRAASATTIVGARNAANSANILTLGTDASNNILLGDGVNNGNVTLNLPSTGFVAYQSAGVNAFTFNPSGATIQFSTTLGGTVNVLAGTAVGSNGAALSITGQQMTGSTSRGGILALSGGQGTKEYGQTKILSGLNLGALSQAVADANTTISLASSVANMIIATGTLTATRTVTITQTPYLGLMKIVRNNCTGGSITFQFLTGTGVTVAAGASAVIGSDGTNAILYMTGT